MSFPYATRKALEIVAVVMVNHGLTPSTIDTVLADVVDRLTADAIDRATTNLRYASENLKAQMSQTNPFDL